MKTKNMLFAVVSALTLLSALPAHADLFCQRTDDGSTVITITGQGTELATVQFGPRERNANWIVAQDYYSGCQNPNANCGCGTRHIEGDAGTFTLSIDWPFSYDSNHGGGDIENASGVFSTYDPNCLNCDSADTMQVQCSGSL